MKILARQLTIDMYDCKYHQLNDFKILQQSLCQAMRDAGYNPIDTTADTTCEEQQIFFIVLQEGHIVVRTYTEFKYVACDIFICQELATPEKGIRSLRKLFKPEKIRMTYLKRGDFGKSTDMKPRIKIRFAPLRPLRFMKQKSANVLKNVAHRIKL